MTRYQVYLLREHVFAATCLPFGSPGMWVQQRYWHCRIAPMIYNAVFMSGFQVFENFYSFASYSNTTVGSKHFQAFIMIFRILILVTLISNVASGQAAFKSRTKAFEFVDSLLAKDKLTVEFLDFVFPQEVQDILLRVQKAMAEKKEWSEEYFSKNYKAGEGLPYHENFGVTREEYQKIKDLDKTPLTIVVQGTSTIGRNRTTGILSFSADEEKAKLFELLEIDFKNELMIFNGDTIAYHNEINAPSTTPFGEWHGYSWKNEISNLGDNEDLKVDKLVSKIIEINMGRVKQNNKILFRLKYKDVNKGQVNANVDMACYLN